MQVDQTYGAGSGSSISTFLPCCLYIGPVQKELEALKAFSSCSVEQQKNAKWTLCNAKVNAAISKYVLVTKQLLGFFFAAYS